MSESESVEDLIERLRDSAHCNDWYLRQSGAAELERLASENAGLEGAIHILAPMEPLSAISWLTDQLKAAEQSARDAREALLRYGRHDGLCSRIGGYGYCNCELEAVTDPIRAAVAEG